MGYNSDIYRQAENKLCNIRRKQEEKNDKKKQLFYQRFKRAKEIDNALSRTSIIAAKSVLNGHDVHKKLEELKHNNLILQKELEQILIDANLPLDYLEPEYHCSLCHDTGFVDGKMCECFKKILKDTAYDSLNRKSPLSLCTFESFNLDFYPQIRNDRGIEPKAKMEKIFKYCKSYAKGFSLSANNLFMQGATGLGKTHLSLAIVNTVINDGFSVIYASCPNIVSNLEKERFSYGNKEKSCETEQYLIECDLLVLDDLGTEFQTNFSNATLYNIINSRIMYTKPTIISTNLSLKEIQKSYSERLVSRIMGNYMMLYFIGQDIRPLRLRQNCVNK